MANREQGYEGQRFERWTAVKFVRKESGYHFWLFRCACGVEREVRVELALAGKSKSCGCINREVTSKRKTTHGRSERPEYSVWRTMIQRCDNPRNISYPRYGAKGVRVCDRWYKFANFFEDMGERPFPGATLERKDNSRGYEPGNVVWATAKQQARNQSSNHRLDYDGESLTIAEWAERTGLAQTTIRNRISLLGWPVARALTAPAGKNGRKRHRQEI